MFTQIQCTKKYVLASILAVLPLFTACGGAGGDDFWLMTTSTFAMTAMMRIVAPQWAHSSGSISYATQGVPAPRAGKM